jgi:hypothetical protein
MLIFGIFWVEICKWLEILIKYSNQSNFMIVPKSMIDEACDYFVQFVVYDGGKRYDYYKALYLKYKK